MGHSGTVAHIDKKDVIIWNVYSILDAFDGHYDDLSDRFDGQF
jgi:hypothetical protein